MSVTGDTAATIHKMEKPLELVYNKDGKLQLNPEALKVLLSIEVPMVVVGVVGAARSGKSYLMNCLARDKNGFSVHSTTQAHTKGIWMWCRSLPQRPNEILLLLDTDGLGNSEKGDINNDRSIFSLAILLSSILIYNGHRNIDQQSLQELHFATKLCKWIQMKSQTDESDFPEFVWVIRDLTLDLKINGKNVTPNEYLEHSLKLKDSEISDQDKEYNELRRCIHKHFPSRCCFTFPTPTCHKKLKQIRELEDKDLDEDFVTARQNLINYIHTHKKVKKVLGGQPVTGTTFIELTKRYMSMMVDGDLPRVESRVARLAEMENQKAVDEAKKFYEDEMNKILEFIEHNNTKSKEVFDIFHKRSTNDNSRKYIQQLKEMMSSTYESVKAKIKKKSQEQCETHLAKQMSIIQTNLLSGYYREPDGFQELKKNLDNALNEYKEKTKDEMKDFAFLKEILGEGTIHLGQEQKKQEVNMAQNYSALEEQLSKMKQQKKQGIKEEDGSGTQEKGDRAVDQEMV